jgi:PKD repeat protein
MKIRLLLWPAGLLALALSCSKEGNPVALPTAPGGPQSPLSLSVKTDRAQLTAGTSVPATITLTATHADGSPAPDGTPVTLNTSLGAFSFDSAGKPVQSATATLVGGRAAVQFFPGAAAGTANIMAAAGTAVAALNLPIVAAPPLPVANFTFAANGLTVLFADASTGSPSGWAWDFGDAQTSSERNPSHTYRSAATYPVMLVVTNAAGQSSKSQFVPVSLGVPPKAAFDFTVTGQQVNFVDMSTDATSWQWSFGDGATSNVRSPVHVYTVAESYTVTLAASNAAGSATANKVVVIAPPKPPKAAFTVAVTGQQANFVDASTDALTWQWSFGDGTGGTTRNPIHTYASAGAYTATLTVANTAGSDTAAEVVTIAAGQPPKSAFTFKANGLQVNFADASTGNPATWNWSFGDGSSSTLPNPLHVYPAYGNYTVVLQVANGNGSNSSSQIVTLTAPAPPVASFTATANPNNQQVNFVDTSAGNPTNWTWDFGDHTAPVSGVQNPLHTYAAAGTYTVTLTASNASGSSKATQAVTTPAAK